MSWFESVSPKNMMSDGATPKFDPQVAAMAQIGAMSPLWLMFIGASTAGMAYWGMTRWMRLATPEKITENVVKLRLVKPVAAPAPAPEPIALAPEPAPVPVPEPEAAIELIAETMLEPVADLIESVIETALEPAESLNPEAAILAPAVTPKAVVKKTAAVAKKVAKVAKVAAPAPVVAVPAPLKAKTKPAPKAAPAAPTPAPAPVAAAPVKAAKAKVGVKKPVARRSVVRKTAKARPKA